MNKKLIFFILFMVVFCGVSFSQTPQSEQVSPFEQAVSNVSAKDPYLRRQAAEQLGSLRDLRAIPYLKKLLKDENPFVRQAAVDSLGLLRARDTVEDIILVLKTDKEPQVKQSAVVALGYIGEPKSVKVLVDLLNDPKETPSVKYAICNTLSIIRSTEPVNSLVNLLSTTDDLNLKRSIIYALGKIPHEESLKALRDEVDKNIQNESLTIDIIRSLIDLGDVESVEKFKVLYSTPSATQKIKFYAGYGLAKLAKDKSVLPTIKKSLKSDDENIKNLAIDALRIIGDRESLVMLKNMRQTETSAYTKMLLDMTIKELERKFPPEGRKQK